MPNVLRATSLVLVACALLACDRDGASRAELAVVTDSGGVAIVTNADPARVTAWSLDAVPELTIGELEGEEAYLLDRVPGAVRLADGAVVVANAGSGELRYYDATGRHVRSVGGAGGGPGEFQGLFSLWEAGPDSLLAYDLRARRITVYGADGTLKGEHALNANGMFMRAVGHLGDGRLVAEVVRRPEGPPPQGISRDTIVLLAFDLATAGIDTIGAFPGNETVINVATSGGEILSVDIAAWPFLKGFRAAAHDDRIAVANTERPEVRLYTAGGELVRIVRWPATPRRPDDGVKQQFTDEEVERAREQDEASVRRRVAEAPWPAELPVIDELRFDSEGRLWVLPAFQDESEWLVFNPEGALLGRLPVPDGFTPTEIEADRVVGVVRDELDVSRVVVLRLETVT